MQWQDFMGIDRGGIYCEEGDVQAEINDQFFTDHRAQAWVGTPRGERRRTFYSPCAREAAQAWCEKTIAALRG